MKIADLVNQFQSEVQLLSDGKDYSRTVVWLKSLGISAGVKTPTGQGIVPYLVHHSGVDEVTIDFD